MQNYYSRFTKILQRRGGLPTAMAVLGFFCMSQIYGQTWETLGSTENVSAGGSSYNNLAIDADGNYYLSYYDTSVSKGSVQKYNGTSWAYLGGSAGITTSLALYNSLSVDGLGNVFYTNQGTGLEVRQFSGSAWSVLPSATTNTINYHASAVSPNNVLFTYSTENSGTVKRYVNGVWEQVGTTGFSGVAAFAEMVIGSDNTVYTCNVSGGNAQVYKIGGTATATDSWTLMGGTTVGAAASSEQYTSDIAIDAANNLYVAYVSNSAGGQKLNVKKFEGGAWVQLGEANFSTGRVQHVAIAVTAGGQPYVVASRWENDDYLRNTAYKFNAVANTWETYGGSFISAGQATHNDLITDNVNHTLILAFTEGNTKVKKISIDEDETEEPVDCSGTDPGQTTGDTGCVSFTYGGETVQYTTVRAADGNIWLQQKLGSSGIATAMADEAAYGDLYQWGRWADGHQKRTSETTGTAPSPNNPSGLTAASSAFITSSPGWWSGNALTDTWTAATPAAVTDVSGCDPCKAALGQDWHLPSQADWTALVESENMSNPATAFSSNLKLPASGYRSDSGAFTFVGTRGYYWSSDTGSLGAKYLYVGTTIANPSAGAPRGQSAAIRCLKAAPQNAITAVTVTTQNNVAATITTTAGTLQLNAAVTPATAAQTVTWSITSGNEFATVSTGGLVTATTNGTVVIRATSTADATKFGELSVVINILVTEECPAVTELYENFDTLSCCAMGVVPSCWDSILLGGASQIISSTQPASGTSQIYQNGYGAGKISIVVLPQFSNVNAGTHQFRFKVKSNSNPGLLDFGYITDIADASTFVVLEGITITNSSYTAADAEKTFTVPATVPANARLAIRNPGTSFAGMYWDDVYWEPIAITAVTVTTQNNVAAAITTPGGTLQLNAAVAPAAAAQTVTWTIASGSEFATISASGIITATANGTVVVRATSTADTTIFGEISIVISNQEPATGNGISGYNYDIIANGVGNANISSEIGLDEVNSRALVSLDFKATASSALPTYGLPVNGQINSANTPGITFQLANYTGKNALYLTPSYVTGSVNSQNSGTLSFEAQNVGTVYILSSAAGGGSTNLPFIATVNFTDGTNQQATLQAKDWYSNSGFAIQGTGRVNRANNNLEGDASNPRLYENSIALETANQAKTISGITFSFSGDATAEYANEIRFAVLSVTTSTAVVTPVEDVLTVTTINNAPATITTNSGTLELDAYLNGAYTADITWMIADGGTGNANIDIYGKVTAVSNGTVFAKATLNSNPAISGTLEITISGQTEGYCESYFVNGCSYLSITDVTTTGGITNISNTASGCSNDNALTGYGDFTAQSVSALHGGVVNFNLSYSTDTAYLSVWIDWNHDFVFADDEQVYAPTGAQSTTTFAVTVPQSALLGATRIRIKAVNGWDGSGPCGYNSIGEVEDYTFNVTEVAAVESVTVSVEDDATAEIIVENGTLQLVATVNPTDATQTVTWTIVSGAEYASVDANGLVLATANGTVVVRATSTEDATKFDDIEITVNYPVVIAIESVTVATENDAVAEITVQNGTLQLVATVNPTDATQTVTWTIVSGAEYASVDANGLVTAIANGVVVIRATSTEDATKFDDIEVLINIEGLGIGDITKNIFTVYPNPTSGNVTINSGKEISRVTVYNQLGQVITTQKGNLVSLAGVQNGVYLMQVTFTDNTTSVCKVIKN